MIGRVEIGMAESRLTTSRSPEQVLGTWSVFCDIAGRVSEVLENPIITVVAVGVSGRVVGTTRRRLLASFGRKPKKWRDGRLPGLRRVVDFIVAGHLPVIVYQLHLSDPARWRLYFAKGKAFSAVARARGEDLPFLDPDLQYRMQLLSSGFSIWIGRVLRTRHFPWSRRGDVVLDLSLVADKELRGKVTETFMEHSFADWNQTSRLRAELGVQPRSTFCCATEQEEPLLLLPDYVAGMYHHADPRTRLFKPVAAPDDCSRLVDVLRKRHGPNLWEQPEDFNQKYPLDHRDHDEVVLT